ncbi:MAG: hypoxanthine phosphoribosyltransferase [Candidatus Margulisbacteria bacterium]|nr:hypoxanthine phosphoribosyltransferase [Candidatus Margulisiibacteriota bacterium]
MPKKTQIAEVVVSRNRLKKRIKELARKISRDYKGKELVLIGILKGSVVFLADLLREINIPVEIDFIQVSSYGASKTSFGVIKIKKDIDLPIVGKHVLLVEDIIDHGYTMHYLLKSLKVKKPKSIRVCALLDKPARREVPVPLAYKGFEVPDKFVVGYGLDLAEKLRNLPYIANLSPA